MREKHNPLWHKVLREEREWTEEIHSFSNSKFIQSFKRKNTIEPELGLKNCFQRFSYEIQTCSMQPESSRSGLFWKQKTTKAYQEFGKYLGGKKEKNLRFLRIKNKQLGNTDSS